MKKFNYGLKVSTHLSYEDALEITVVALKSQGFGVLTEVDVKSTLKTKIDVDFKRYMILGACNPNLAHAALEVDGDLGLLLPCNVIVYEDGEGSIVAVMDPNLMVGITDNAALNEVASKARSAMEEVLKQVEAA